MMVLPILMFLLVADSELLMPLLLAFYDAFLLEVVVLLTMVLPILMFLVNVAAMNLVVV